MEQIVSSYKIEFDNNVVDTGPGIITVNTTRVQVNMTSNPYTGRLSAISICGIESESVPFGMSRIMHNCMYVYCIT